MAVNPGTDPPRLRIGVRSGTAPGGLADVAPVCADAAEEIAALLDSFGHDVTAAGPGALDDVTALVAFATIQETAVETHRRWAEWLNHRVVEILAGFGAQVEELRFGEDLDFSVKVWNGQQLARGKAALQLSAGARDQLWLAIRLAIAEFLSRREDPMPLLVDDPFVSSDDARARAGLRLLIGGLPARHQVVLVTCHRQRFEHLAALDPDLYEARVLRLEMRTAAVRS